MQPHDSQVKKKENHNRDNKLKDSKYKSPRTGVLDYKRQI